MDEILNRIKRRINTINNSYKRISTSEAIKIDLTKRNINMLYKHVYRYSGVEREKHPDPIEYAIYTGVWQEYIVQTYLQNDEIKNIVPTERSSKKKEIFKLDRQSAVKNIPEKLQCKSLKTSVKETCLGKIYDFQVPLRASIDDCKGELDLVAAVNDTMRIIEYKTPISDEPLLRAVLEAITYYRQINGQAHAKSDYLIDFNNVFGTHCVKVGIAIVVPETAYLFGHDKAYELIDDYCIQCFTFADKSDYRTIIRINEENLKKYRTAAQKNMQCLTEHSKEILSLFHL